MLNKLWRIVDKRFTPLEAAPSSYQLDNLLPGDPVRIKVKYQTYSELLDCKVVYVDGAKLFFELRIQHPKLASMHYLRHGDHLTVLRTAILEVLKPDKRKK